MIKPKIIKFFQLKFLFKVVSTAFGPITENHLSSLNFPVLCNKLSLLTD